MNLRRSDVPDEPVLRRCVSHVWHRRAPVPRVGSRGPGRPDDLRISSDDQVHLLQVRGERRGREARRRLYIAPERGQREDLRFSLVLVPLSRRAQLHHGLIQGNCSSPFFSFFFLLFLLFFLLIYFCLSYVRTYERMYVHTSRVP